MYYKYDMYMKKMSIIFYLDDVSLYYTDKWHNGSDKDGDDLDLVKLHKSVSC